MDVSADSLFSAVFRGPWGSQRGEVTRPARVTVQYVGFAIYIFGYSRNTVANSSAGGVH